MSKAETGTNNFIETMYWFKGSLSQFKISSITYAISKTTRKIHFVKMIIPTCFQN